MKHFLLYGYGGAYNHGAEAIVRTTIPLLRRQGGEVVLSTHFPEQDKEFGVDILVDKLIPADLSYVAQERKAATMEEKEAYAKLIYQNALAEIDDDTVCIGIGGDNYCYEWSARQGVMLNKAIRKYCTSSILWGCSVDPEAITPEVREDLAGYDLITAREPITYQLLKDINPNTVKVADPAFLLERTDLPLPEGFQEGNTVGINVSPLIMKYGTEGSLILDNYRLLIRYILEKTDMSVCLISHVVWPYNNDLEPIDVLYHEFGNFDRVSRITDGNCCELKGYIARCRFFVGARTHATIAAYSSCVPTLVVGYSVKSRGIAQDLFGTDKGYVLPVQKLNNKHELKASFQRILDQEQEQRNRLTEVIPSYKKLAASAADYIL